MNRLRRKAVISALVLAVLLTAGITCRLVKERPVSAQPASSEAVAAEASDPLTEYRTQRQQLRQREQQQQNDILHTPGGDPEVVALAQREWIDLMDREEKETAIEGILSARGFGEVLASVSDQCANVLLRADSTLTQRETAVILDLVMRQTGFTGGNVKIIPIN